MTLKIYKTSLDFSNSKYTAQNTDCINKTAGKLTFYFTWEIPVPGCSPGRLGNYTNVHEN